MRSLRTITKSNPRLLQLEKAREQQQRPNAAKDKEYKLKKKKATPSNLYTVIVQHTLISIMQKNCKYYVCVCTNLPWLQ